MIDVKIRKTKLEDYEDIKAIHKEVGIVLQNMRPDVFDVNGYIEISPELFADVLKNFFMLSAVVKGKAKEKVVGFLRAVKKDYSYSTESALFINELAVSEKYRKHGIGTLLMEKAEGFAKSHGLFVALNVWQSNRKAVAFYERLGYVPRTVVLEKKRGDILNNENEFE